MLAVMIHRMRSGNRIPQDVAAISSDDDPLPPIHLSRRHALRLQAATTARDGVMTGSRAVSSAKTRGVQRLLILEPYAVTASITAA